MTKLNRLTVCETLCDIITWLSPQWQELAGCLPKAQCCCCVTFRRSSDPIFSSSQTLWAMQQDCYRYNQHLQCLGTIYKSAIMKQCLIIS